MSVKSYDEKILATLDQDGSRKWIRPRLSEGARLAPRRAVAWALMFLFVGLPWLEVHGRQAILLDLPRRQFVFFGLVLTPTDTLLLMLFLLAIFLSVFLVTALLGRAWCGWACPQTVYMEFLYRPLERLIEGGRTESIRMDRKGWTWRRAAKHLVFLVPSFLLANTFLAYFVGTDVLLEWMQRSPLEHPASFAVMAVTFALVNIDFAFFREQMCTIACPYARLQSALLDRDSLVVAYDTARGEPRGKVKGKAKEDAPPKGDCIDCFACVHTCPTGIDIRDGLQLECIACTQCMDACDAVMDKLERPRGLVRYTSQRQLEGGKRRILRVRVAIYTALVLGLVIAFSVLVSQRATAKVTVLRGLTAPFIEQPDGRIANPLRVRVKNQGEAEATYTLHLLGPEGGAGAVPAADDLELVAPQSPVTVPAGEIATLNIVAIAGRAGFEAGERPIRLVVDGTDGFASTTDYKLLGPKGGTP